MIFNREIHCLKAFFSCLHKIVRNPGNNLYFFLDADKSQQSLPGTYRSMKVIGFVSKEKIPKNKMLGDGNMVFYATKDNPVRYFFRKY